MSTANLHYGCGLACLYHRPEGRCFTHGRGKKYKKHAHEWLIQHGMYVCKARKPQCEICGVKQYCDLKK